MGSGYGLSRIVQGAARGVSGALDYEQGKEDRAKEDLLFNQGQEDRKYTNKRRRVTDKRTDTEHEYQLGRREITDERADEQYAIQKELQEFQLEFNSALSQFGMTGDPKSIEKLYNEKYPDGGKVKVIQEKDGSYSLTFTKDGRTVNEMKNLSVDDFGSLAMGMKDPAAWLAARKETSAKAAEMKHDIDKIDRKGEWDMKVKQASEGAGSAGGSVGLASKLGKEQRQVVGQGLTSLRQTYGGKMEGGFWFPDEANKDEAQVAFSLLEKKIRGGQTNGQQAALEARTEAMKVTAAAETQVKKEGLSGEDAAARRSELILSFGLQTSKAGGGPKPKRSGTVERGTPGGASPAAIAHLKKNKDNVELRKKFDEKFGKGEAAKVLGGGGGTKLEREKAPKGGGGGISLVRDAGASEKPASKKSVKLEKQGQARNPRKEFDKVNRGMANALKAKDRKYLNSYIKKMDDDYMKRLTPKQRTKAKANIAKAKAILGIAE
ncbi:MAG TPA: hypothetical protein ENJ35_11385 [Gammaproteobacteria bacterium]|nr:hypothetical protein [Gammaproteobacteria bacterium]